MPGNLNVQIELKKPIGVEKDGHNQDAKGFQKVKIIPKDVGIWGFQPPLYKSSNTVVKGIPQTQPEIGPFPDTRYVFNKFQAGKMNNKFTQ